MAKTVCIDSNIFVWGVKKIASEGQESMMARVDKLLDYFDEEDYTILLPSPIITEVLSPVSDNQARAVFMETIRAQFKIGVLDGRAAQKSAEIWNSNKDSWQTFYEDDLENGLKRKFKYDILIVGIAIVQGANVLYSHDSGLRNIANAHGLEARDVPELSGYDGSQNSLFGDQTFA